jgi:prepilin-type N-terminal cleavage/methylation domain-containing protein
MARQAGFTLIELLIALALSALISLALVVAFRLGVQFLERGRGFYGDLQETLAILSHVRRTVEATPRLNIHGDAELLTLAKQGGGLRCHAQDDGTIALESWALVAKQPPPVMIARPVAQADEPITPPNPDDITATPLLDKLSQCQFDYLVGQAAAGPTTAPPPAGKAAEAVPSSYSWQADYRKGTLAAIRLTLATTSLALPPVVLMPGR